MKMEKALTLIQGVAKIRSLLGLLSIKTKNDAIAWLHFRSLVNSKAIGDRLTAESTNFLEEEGIDIQEAEDGMQVRRVVKDIKIYNETPAVIKAKAAVKKAEETLAAKKEVLESAQEKAGYTTKKGKPYYQAV